MDRKSIFDSAWSELNHRQRRLIRDFCARPDPINRAYAIGYIGALNDERLISEDTYTYLLAFFGNGPADLIEYAKQLWKEYTTT